MASNIATTGTFPVPKIRDVDCGWAWIILVANFTAMVVICGLCFNLGIYFVAILEEFDESRSKTAIIGALNGFMFHLAGPMTSLILPYLGPRKVTMIGAALVSVAYILMSYASSIIQIIIFNGIFSGTGFFLVTGGFLASLPLYFNKYLYLAAGITSSGGGVGIVAFAILTEWLMEVFGWRGSLLMLAGFSLQMCICSAVIFKNPQVQTLNKLWKKSHNGAESTDDHLQSDPSTSKNKRFGCRDYRYFRDPCFWCIIGFIMLTNASWVSVYLFFKDMLIDVDLEQSFKLVMSCMGIGNIAGRICGGFAAMFVNPIIYCAVISLIGAFDYAIFTVANTTWAFSIASVVLGFSNGTMAAMQAIVIAHVFGKDNMSIIWGYGLGFGCITILIGPPMFGYIADSTRGYTWVILTISSLLAAASICMLIIFPIHRNRLRKMKTTADGTHSQQNINATNN